jgi:hypothetical protein
MEAVDRLLLRKLLSLLKLRIPPHAWAGIVRTPLLSAKQCLGDYLVLCLGLHLGLVSYICCLFTHPTSGITTRAVADAMLDCSEQLPHTLYPQDRR